MVARSLGYVAGCVFADSLKWPKNEQALSRDFFWVLRCSAWGRGFCLFLFDHGAALAFAAGMATVLIRPYMSSGHDVSMMSLVGMGFRQVNSQVIVRAKIMAAQAGLDISSKTGMSTKRLKAHYTGRRQRRRRTCCWRSSAHRAGIPLDFDRAAAIDLAGRTNVLDAVQETSVMPKIIDCPDPRGGKPVLSARGLPTASNYWSSAQVTVRTNLAQLIGGATEETIDCPRGAGDRDVDQLLQESRGSAGQSQQNLSRALLDRGLDAQTAFEIVASDIAAGTVGQNIGARLPAAAAQSDTRVARAKAEQQRAEAIALEQEMKAKVAENRARLVQAEAEVPIAMAEAFRKEHLNGAGVAGER